LSDSIVKSSDDIVASGSISGLVRKMNSIGSPFSVDEKILSEEIRAYDDRIGRGPAFFNDDQLRRIADFRKYRGDRLRMCKFQKINDEKAMPLIAIGSSF
jgi:predicted oxidoreductase